MSSAKTGLQSYGALAIGVRHPLVLIVCIGLVVVAALLKFGVI